AGAKNPPRSTLRRPNRVKLLFLLEKTSVSIEPQSTLIHPRSTSTCRDPPSGRFGLKTTDPFHPPPRRSPPASSTPVAAHARAWAENLTVTDDNSTDHPGGARAPRQPSPKLTIDLSDADAIARTAHDVAVALAEGRLSGRAGQALMTAIRLAIE